MQTHKIVHRDIKPGNMLLDQNLHIKLIDFGESKQLEDNAVEKAKKEIENHLEISNKSATLIDVEISFMREDPRRVSYQYSIS